MRDTFKDTIEKTIEIRNNKTRYKQTVINLGRSIHNPAYYKIQKPPNVDIILIAPNDYTIIQIINKLF